LLLVGITNIPQAAPPKEEKPISIDGVVADFNKESPTETLITLKDGKEIHFPGHKPDSGILLQEN
jgi:hypothetical protein